MATAGVVLDTANIVLIISMATNRLGHTEGFGVRNLRRLSVPL